MGIHHPLPLLPSSPLPHLPQASASRYDIPSLWLQEVPLADPGETALPARTDVVVIGGGYTGVAAGLALARAGVAVLVLDREAPGWGASSRNGGFVLPGFKRDLSAIVRQWGRDAARTLFAESLESITFLETLIAAEGIECQFRRSGHLTLAESRVQANALARERDLLHAVTGHQTRLVSGTDIHGEIGSRRYRAGLLDESAGSVHPAALFRGLAGCAARAGATLLGRTEATGVAGKPGDLAVRTSRGIVRATHVIVATNGYGGGGNPEFRRRVIPIGSHIIATAPLDPALRGSLIPRSRVVSDSRNLLHYFRLSGDGRLLFGGRASFRPDRSGADAEAATILRRDMVAVFPQLERTPVQFAWSGNVGFTRDQMPHVAPLGNVLGVGGYCGHGVAMAIYLGFRVGQHLAEGRALPFLASLGFPAVPLYNGHPWFLPLAGAWYQLIDWTRSRR